jgi:hypothetical protein
MDEAVREKWLRTRACCRWAEVASISIHTPGNGHPRRRLQYYSLCCSDIPYAMINDERAILVAGLTPMEPSLLHWPLTVRPFCTTLQR